TGPVGESAGATGPAVVEEVTGGRRAAIDEAVRRAGADDVIAVLGKGHERGQEVAGVTHPFDDRVELAAALRARFGHLVGQR
ncbi:MAG TPA: UDP-N-acetylmuramoyl-L-alanyl-D-glutamate--2,6-diaminopimelate ligase, partial [Asanoa sp.]|nr:UDP-N-acetylmuramoyl-L-alanyl-D-glutamate--2,6-diaminopimelate ligase [Asanoa sp.]